ncbi:MAG TPA: zf-HC2 domain-containing protein [Chloroflexota bacterium]
MDHVSDLLSSYMDGQASLPERQMVEAHLEECEACRDELTELRALKAALARLPSHTPRRSFVLGPRAPRPAALSGTWGGFVRAASSVAAALVVVAVGFSLAFQGLPRQPATTAAPAPLSQAAPAAAAARPAASAAAPAGAAASVGPNPAPAAAPPVSRTSAAPASAPLNVPRLAGELIIALAALGLAVYSIRWWRG